MTEPRSSPRAGLPGCSRYSGSGTTTGTYSHTYTNVLSQSYAGSASSALSAQADAMYRGAGKSALVSTGTGTYTCTYSCGGITTPTQPRVIIPPKPPIDQNPNNGPHPKPAPTRPKPKVDWGGNGNGDGGGWKPGDVIDLIIGAAQMLDLADNDDYAPDDAQELLPAPVDNPGGKNNGRDRDDEKCDVGPGVSPTGHAVYLPRERYYDTFEDRYECRATGVYGLLDQSDYNKGRKAPGTNTNSSTRPPGMAEIVQQGHIPANGHLIPAAASGSGIDLRNLVAEYEQTNSPYLNHGVEKEIRNFVKSGKHVEISVIPHYGNSGSGIPTEIEYNYGTVEDGNMKHCVITQSPTGGTTRGSADCPRR
ncbi:hypothetical protein [Streptomyces sp. Agncl-13]|uniref:hypothetical protein n=1 Tax=Streptomyces sp. Agncl-13 TaxID=3400628 RepID=UPI003A8A952B